MLANPQSLCHPCILVNFRHVPVFALSRLFQHSGFPRVELEGTVEVLHEDRDVGSRYIYFLNTPAAERLELRFGTNAPALVSGERIRARGRRSNGVLALSSGDTVQALAASPYFRTQKTLVC
jgi:hypothetical protein